MPHPQSRQRRKRPDALVQKHRQRGDCAPQGAEVGQRVGCDQSSIEGLIEPIDYVGIVSQGELFDQGVHVEETYESLGEFVPVDGADVEGPEGGKGGIREEGRELGFRSGVDPRRRAEVNQCAGRSFDERR